MAIALKNCAIYTRKSSEEGLEQGFNSLDAQREACLAYITSQKAEGWASIKEQYDDGGFSGGNMDRPGLAKLLEDIQAGKINIIVVYKIDRLTRSLMDFAKLVEIFDKHGVTFVSVTQSFNTTTSMGRLTLNVLLSFAQFEREVTGERIRDKIAASKKKGMWMGGARPTGYDVQDKQLVINHAEAELVRLLFQKYIELGCVRRLKEYLDFQGIKTKNWTSRKDRVHGGTSFGRGILYKILSNPIYIGKIRHKEKTYEGQHEPILSYPIWDRTQEMLLKATVSSKEKPAVEGNLLKGKLFDYVGNPYSPVFTSKGARQYRYYTNQALLQDRTVPSDVVSRIPAQDIESLIENQVKQSFPDRGISEVSRVTIHPGQLKITIADTELLVPFEPIQSGRSFVIPNNVPVRDPLDLPAPQLKALIKGTIWRDDYFGGMSMGDIAKREGTDERHVRRLITNSLTII
ncbi:MAG: recombinase family protein [Alphaproteobacteria bacterium]